MEALFLSLWCDFWEFRGHLLTLLPVIIVYFFCRFDHTVVLVYYFPLSFQQLESVTNLTEFPYELDQIQHKACFL